MKIFISHSSRDKWAAKIISKEIIEIGHNTFLDEKDIRTGESIDKSIKTNLKNADHFLILISPDSVKSEWVLIELGGAIALELTVIPILLYVDANLMPKVISLSLARDINDIDRYFEELKSKKVNSKTKVWENPNYKHTYKMGDIVKLIPVPTEINIISPGRGIFWGNPMNKYAERRAKIVKLDARDETYNIDIDNGEFYWQKEWLIKEEHS